MKNKKSQSLEITELFMAKAGKQGWDRCFHGTIRREIDKNGKPIVFGRINVKDGYVVSQASDQWKLGDNLDEIVLMVLDYGLHSDGGQTITIAGSPIFLN